MTVSPTPKPLSRLMQGAPVALITGNADVPIAHIACDSRQVQPGGLFVATTGFNVDGHDYVHSALRKGAVAVLAERGRPANLGEEVTWARVEDTRASVGWVAANLWDAPSDAVEVLAVTGTNGKTSVVWLLDQILRAHGAQPALHTTVASRIGGKSAATELTTPMGHQMQEALAEMRATGATHGLFEASSHGLALGRLNGTRVRVGGFTNLSRDHIDFHGSMAAYLEAKAKLFEGLAERACFHIGDAAGAELAAKFTGRKLTVGIDLADADWSITGLQGSLDGTQGTLAADGQAHAFSLPIPGRHNVENALVALGMAHMAGVPLATGLKALANAEGAPGRLERVAGPQRVLVDYAHTPDALHRVLEVLRPLTAGKLICVFGAGGDRDPGKRPQMAARVADHADVAMVTSDNPRSEDPQAIVDQILAGFGTSPTLAVHADVDRRAAIAAAIGMAGPTDTVLIAGKGHEPYQLIGDQVLDFDDRAVAREVMA